MTAGEEDGKELQRMHGYDCYDYGARHSQTTLGRFTTIDPLAERYYDISPYVLCGGNPVRYVDLDGRDIWEINSTGETVSRTTNTDVDRFEFVNADGSKTGIEGDNGLNFISTSHEKGKDSSATELFENQLSNGYTIRSHTHNHPSGNSNNSRKDNSFYQRIIDITEYNKNYRKGANALPIFHIYTKDYCDVYKKDFFTR